MQTMRRRRLSCCKCSSSVVTECAASCSRLVSLATGWASSRLPWTRLEHRNVVIAASAFGNTNSALLMLVSAMCAQQSLPFFAALGEYCVRDVRPAPCQMLLHAA